KFPSTKLEDVADIGKAPLLLDRHPPGKDCPASPRPEHGTVLARVFGRALGKDGKPLADTVRQEHYVEDRFFVPVAMQQPLPKALGHAGANRFRVPDGLARLLVSHAYLGQLDVCPVSPPGGKGRLDRCEFWARKADGGIRIEGKSEATGTSAGGAATDGRLWEHEVKLVWEGLIQTRGDRITRLLLLARGPGTLRWGNVPEPSG